MSKTNKQFDSNNLQNPYTGKSYNNNEINSLIKQKNLKKILTSNISKIRKKEIKFSKADSKDNVIGFLGKDEFELEH